MSDPIATLHIVNRASEQGNTLNAALAAMQPQDHLILIEDAVYAACLPEWTWVTGHCHLLAEDANARGLSLDSLPPTLTVIPMDAFVALTVRCHRSLSWH